jgi:hypothetical protein
LSSNLSAAKKKKKEEKKIIQVNFKPSLCYTVRPCLKKQSKAKQHKQNPKLIK